MNKKEGIGLGASFSKEFIEAQGGSIKVKNEFGAGSTFAFALHKLQADNVNTKKMNSSFSL